MVHSGDILTQGISHDRGEKSKFIKVLPYADIHAMTCTLAAVNVDMRELQHRMNNMLTVVQSIFTQTMRQSATKEELARQFSARLRAYSKSVDLLVANNWRGLEISELICAQLAIFGNPNGNQISADGPKLRLSAQGAHSLGLALHELATNAVKYGSLSVPPGRVDITWSVLKTDVGERFHLLWREAGGPTVAQPLRRGFGRQIIENVSASALSGQTNYEFLSDGVRWSIDAPVSSALVEA